ncbi:macro domain-containing protein [Synechococcus elongatus IITB7]|uniref:macro domain-containing protein n=1 Tax=Synechococcus elongatus TaxID=32046 RepID=UPI0030D014B0
MELFEVFGDLLEQDVEVIVNAWNRNLFPWWLLLPQGVSGAIKRRGGLAPFRELRKYGPLPLGAAVLTSAGRLPYRAIIHVAGINLCWRSTHYSIQTSVKNLLILAEAENFRSLALPIIGAGSGSMSQAKARHFILETLEANQHLYSGKVIVVSYAKQR